MDLKDPRENPTAVKIARQAVKWANDQAVRRGEPELAIEYDQLGPAAQHLVAHIAVQAYKWRAAFKRHRN